MLAAEVAAAAALGEQECWNTACGAAGSLLCKGAVYGAGELMLN